MIENNDLKKASENFYIKKDELYNDILIATNKKTVRLPARPIRRLTALFIALSVLLAGCMTAYAVSPEFRNYLNLWFMTDSNRQETVPDGYTGIYSLEDLNNVRNNLGGKYIMMNDLTFSDSDFAESGAYAGGWVAIGDEVNPFTGIFDGNGYVINNLNFKLSGKFSGLFGYVYEYEYTDPVESIEGYINTHDDNLDNAGLIKNLGLNKVTANIVIDNKDIFKSQLFSDSELACYIGSIAGVGNYLISCYVNDVNINVKLENYVPNNEYGECINIGGLSGRASIIDSCYSNSDIVIIDNNNYDVSPFAGGIAAVARNVVTSFFKGTITINGEQKSTDLLLAYDSLMPCIMTEKRYNEVSVAIKKSCGTTPRNYRVFQAFYNKKIVLYQREKAMLFNNIDTSGVFYILEPASTIKELMRLDSIVLQAYSEDDFRQGTFNDGVKDKINYCYVLQDGTSYDQNHFEQFDFQNIWVMKDGVPKLRIFES